MKVLKRLILFFVVIISYPLLNFSAPIAQKLGNGSTLIYENDTGAGVVLVDLWVAVGALDEKPADYGLSHFLEHIIFKGSSKYPKERVDRIVTRGGGEINGATSKHFTHFYIKGLNDYFDTFADILSSNVFHPRIDAARVEVEKGVVLSELERIDNNPDRTLNQMFFENFYKDTRIAHPVIGYPRNIKAYNVAQIRKYHLRYLYPSRVYWVVIGDVPFDKVKSVLSNIKLVSAPQTRSRSFGDYGFKTGHFTHHSDINYRYKMIGFPAPAYDDIVSTALDIFAEFLTGGRASFLFNKFVATGLAQSVDAYYLTAVYPSFFALEYAAPAANSDIETRLISAVKKSVNTMSRQDFNNTKKRIERDYVFSKESMQGRAGLYGYYATMGALPYALHYLDYVKQMKFDNFKQIIRRILDEKTFTLEVSGSAGAGK